MQLAQPGILADNTALARYLSFSIDSTNDLATALQALTEYVDPEKTVIGIGQSLAGALGRQVAGLRIFNAQTGCGVDMPATPAALWCWCRGSDRGELYHRTREIESILAPAFVLNDAIDSFQYVDNRDLSGYVDGTENPKNAAAIAAAIVQGQGAALDGSSYVAVQQWLHDFDCFDEMTTVEQDDTIGRHISDNAEFDAPDSAHVKRAAQESFKPEAFILRRSMPWTEGVSAGLVFVAFGKSLDAFEAILSRMLGQEDGICDALLTFTRPVSGAYYWCPPVKNGKLNLAALGV